MKNNKKFYEFINKQNILITCHTGFKGSLLTYILLFLGGKIIGVSKHYKLNYKNFKTLNLIKKIINYKTDITNYKELKKIILKHKPRYIFHLAAQSLVLKSIKDPMDTVHSNILGTVNLLQILKEINFKVSVLIITSDKVYEKQFKFFLS